MNFNEPEAIGAAKISSGIPKASTRSNACGARSLQSRRFESNTCREWIRTFEPCTTFNLASLGPRPDQKGSDNRKRQSLFLFFFLVDLCQTETCSNAKFPAARVNKILYSEIWFSTEHQLIVLCGQVFNLLSLICRQEICRDEVGQIIFDSRQ